MAEMSKAEKLARAVLLFFRAEPWTRGCMQEWIDCTGNSSATSRSLCDLAREVRADEEAKNSG